MTKTYKYACFVLMMFLFLIGVKPASAILEVKELSLISNFMDENFTNFKKIYRLSKEMKEQARPFGRKHHRDRYRFEPGDNIPREIMTLSRNINARFKLISGIIGQSSVRNKHAILNDLTDVNTNITVFCKRAIRANKDNNYALYLASAQGIEKEVVTGNSLLNDLEIVINDCIAEADLAKESL